MFRENESSETITQDSDVL